MRAERKMRTTRARLVVVVSGLLLAALVVLGAISIIILRQNLVSQAETTLYLSNESARNQVEATLERTGALPAFDDFSIVVPPDGVFLVLEGDTPRLSAFFTRDYSYRPLSAAEARELRSRPFALDDTRTIRLRDYGSYLVTASSVEGAEGVTYTVLNGVGLTDTDAVVTTYVLWITAVGLAVAVLAATFGYRLIIG